MHQTRDDRLADARRLQQHEPEYRFNALNKTNELSINFAALPKHFLFAEYRIDLVFGGPSEFFSSQGVVEKRFNGEGQSLDISLRNKYSCCIVLH